MSTASPFADPALQTAPASAATSHAGIADNVADRAAPSRDETLEAARAFEKLLIHDMLKTMRRTAATLGEEPSNARSMYDDMLDEHLAGVMSEAGGLGLAETLVKQLAPRENRDGPAAYRSADDTALGTSASEGSGTGNVLPFVAPEAAAPHAALPAVASMAADRLPTSTDVPVRGLATADVIRLRSLVNPGEPGSGVPPRGGPDSTRYSDITMGGIDPSALIRARTRVVGGDDERIGLAEKRAFIEPLRAHAEASAERIGTAPEAVLAIAALESGWGRHVMKAPDGQSSHNLFGIKARPGETNAVSARTHEYIGGERRRVVADFRAFADPAAAVSGFADFVLDNPRYAEALEHAKDPNEFLRRLHAAGYATDPRYADKAIETMQRVRNLGEGLS